MRTIVRSMRNVFTTILAFFIYSVLGGQSIYSWTEQAPFPGPGRFDYYSFVVDNQIYVASGTRTENNLCTYYQSTSTLLDLYRYDPATNSWQILYGLSFTGSVSSGFTFTIGSKAYLGQRIQGTGFILTEYSPSTNTSVNKAPLNDDMFYTSAGAYGNKGYVIGRSTTANVEKLYEYDAITNQWSALADPGSQIPGFYTNGGACFMIDDNLYVGCGNGSQFSQMYRYNITNQSWQTIANMPTDQPFQSGQVIHGFAIEKTGYMMIERANGERIVYSYNPETDTWTNRGTHSGTPHRNGRLPGGNIPTVVGNKLYYGLGEQTSRSVCRTYICGLSTCEDYTYTSTYTSSWRSFSHDCTSPVVNNTINAPNPTTFCGPGQPDTIRGATASGGINSLQYQWQSRQPNGWTNILGATNSWYRPDTLFSTTRFRRVVLSTGCQNNRSDSITITILPKPNKPTINQPDSVDVCTGDSILLRSSIPGNNTWLRNQSLLAGATADSIWVKEAGSYRVVQTNSFNCTDTSTIVRVFVRSIPATPTITSSGTFGASFCPGDSIQLMSSYTNSNQWFRNQQAIQASTTSIWVKDAASYQVEHTSIYGCISRSQAFATSVRTRPDTPVITIIGNRVFCAGDTIRLQTNTTNSVQWLKQNSPIAGATQLFLDITQTGTYSVTQFDGFCTSIPSIPVQAVATDCSFPTNPYPFVQFPGDRLPNQSAFQSLNLRLEDRPIITPSGDIYFAARKNGSVGTGLWKTNGTKQGTTLIKSVSWNDQIFLPRRFTYFQGNVYFTANNGTSGFELWKTDGTEEGTSIVLEITPGNNTNTNSEPQNLIVAGDLLYFTINRDLWCTDGTSNGTRLVKANCFDFGSFQPSDFSFLAFNNRLYFTGYDPTANNELWTSDGTEAGTFRVADLNSGAASGMPGHYIAGVGVFYFVTSNTLWRSDGTGGGTQLVKSFVAINRNGIFGKPSLFLNNQTLYFSATVGSSNNYELWKSDGTDPGTILVRDINTGTNVSSFPEGFVSYGGSVYFSAQTSATGYELWKTDGTQAGTVLVRDISSGNNSSSVSDLVEFQGELYFAASSSSGRELWKTDGTAANTILVKDIAQPYSGGGLTNSNPTTLLPFANKLLFLADDGLRGVEWWESDGTESGTHVMVDINQQTTSITGPIAAPVSPTGFDLPDLAYANGAVYFTANVFNTTAGNTRQIIKTMGLDTASLIIPNTEFARGLVGFGEWVYFIKSTSNGGTLFKTNGDTVDQMPASIKVAGSMVKAGPYLYFVNVADSLYRTDGSEAGTISLGVKADPYHMIAIDSVLYFAGNQGGSNPNVELWRSQGTPQTTSLVREIGPGSVSSNPTNLVAFQNKVSFQTNVGGSNQAGTGTWISDGTSSGTFQLGPTWRPLASTNTFLFGKIAQATGERLWRSDGSVGSFAVVDTILTFTCSTTNFGDVFNQRTVSVGNVCYFYSNLCGGPTNRVALWRTDGTDPGTYIIKIFDVLSPDQTSKMMLVGSSLLLRGSDSTYGVELWRSDGSLNCTHLVADLNPFTNGVDPVHAFPGSFLVTPEEVLYFVAQSVELGTVLYKYNPALPANNNGAFYFTGNGNWSQSQNWCEGMMPPSVLRAGSSIILNPSSSAPVIMDRPQTIKRGATLNLSPNTNLVIPSSFQLIKRD